MTRRPTRRLVVAGGIGLGVGLGLIGARRGVAWLRQPRARVAVLRVETYDDLAERLFVELERFPRALERARSGPVVLKPNLVEIHPGRPINTEPTFVVAVAEALLRHGAASVVVAEGPGHTRDTEAVLHASGLGPLLAERRLSFVDLNVDDVVEMSPPFDLAGHGRLPIARTVAEAALVVSLPRLKTHHHAGVTLGMKNLFGVVPGAAWGWPKNRLHWGGIPESIADLWSLLQPGLTVADGLVGMEGDGPILGATRPHGVVVLGEQACAVDATTARMMGMDPTALPAFQLAARCGGTVSTSWIALEGDDPVAVRYAPAPGFEGAVRSEQPWPT